MWKLFVFLLMHRMCHSQTFVDYQEVSQSYWESRQAGADDVTGLGGEGGGVPSVRIGGNRGANFGTIASTGTKGGRGSGGKGGGMSGGMSGDEGSGMSGSRGAKRERPPAIGARQPSPHPTGGSSSSAAISAAVVAAELQDRRAILHECVTSSESPL
jgi:hypothetical protein